MKAFAPIAALTLFASPALAQQAPPPQLVVAISVDQFAADVLARYRGDFSAGFVRLLGGANFDGYQGHANTETCPGHSTILTGIRPARTGIVANDWYAATSPRPDKRVYCVEDETIPGSTYQDYKVSLKHLRVPTLGDRMKAANPASRVVSVAGKDRAAVLLGGKSADQTWWWWVPTSRFASYDGRPLPATLVRANAAIQAQLAKPQPPLEEPPLCAGMDRAVPVGSTTVGTFHFGRAIGDAKAFKISDELDGATLAIAAGLVQEMKLGRGPAPDLLAVGLSANDYIGHAYGNGGPEMCLHLLALDRSLGDFFAFLDQTGVDYEVMLTADHGSQDIPERGGPPPRERITSDVNSRKVGETVAAALGLPANPLHALDAYGDVWIDPSVTGAVRNEVIAATVAAYQALPQVATVLTHAQLLATPIPTSAPDKWTLAEKARASFDAERSGDLVVLLKQGVVPIAKPSETHVDAHGVPWDSDRRVPILFWRKGIAGFTDPRPVETVDIMPTLAATLHLPLPVKDYDGKCLNLGPSTTCPR